MLHIERVRGTDEGVLVLDSNSLSRSEISINLFRANWEAVRAILTFARVTFFRGDEHLVFSSCMAGSSDMPGTIAGRKDNLLLSLPRDIPIMWNGFDARLYFCRENGNLTQFWNGGTRY